jgi:hypothetical protein
MLSVRNGRLMSGEFKKDVFGIEFIKVSSFELIFPLCYNHIMMRKKLHKITLKSAASKLFYV